MQYNNDDTEVTRFDCINLDYVKLQFIIELYSKFTLHVIIYFNNDLTTLCMF